MEKQKKKREMQIAIGNTNTTISHEVGHPGQMYGKSRFNLNYVGSGIDYCFLDSKLIQNNALRDGVNTLKPFTIISVNNLIKDQLGRLLVCVRS